MAAHRRSSPSPGLRPPLPSRERDKHSQPPAVRPPVYSPGANDSLPSPPAFSASCISMIGMSSRTGNRRPQPAFSQTSRSPSSRTFVRQAGQTSTVQQPLVDHGPHSSPQSGREDASLGRRASYVNRFTRRGPSSGCKLPGIALGVVSSPDPPRRNVPWHACASGTETAAAIRAALHLRNGRMRILAIETSGPRGGIALACHGEAKGDQPGRCIIQEVRLAEGLRHGRDLVLAAKDACDRAGWDPRVIPLVAVSIGPGSFTGIRIAVMVAKFMALETGAKIVAVPSFRALAANAPADKQRIVTIVDAKRGGLFASVFERIHKPRASPRQWKPPAPPGDTPQCGGLVRRVRGGLRPRPDRPCRPGSGCSMLPPTSSAMASPRVARRWPALSWPPEPSGTSAHWSWPVWAWNWRPPAGSPTRSVWSRTTSARRRPWNSGTRNTPRVIEDCGSRIED